ncbi:sigma-54 dependent transcriptional regulator [Gilvimarinus sp. SDUM040013]|uniref:Sigma-54 dependent transcriptional regulator n=1 Tax=Gilvimarinus gilvus TaxID=3058038 RepID=A0ABU4RV88_9GAMM|nr:sigma-54 dependent transcriptional regulator [Gilvimarinus sp. SDUM040013]MDO3387859.1 sigma-54 dependent transcriptional regulator [Gilvimarinus sp. SDUM040013]MDX6848770.1 sigma-54 dependent transcriptional regulator [Gilvimarinus sp. SDUM040013]
MQIIVRDTELDTARMLDGYDCPAILMSADYKVLAANDLYTSTFGAIDPVRTPHCYQVSHGYDRPCDQAGESCPLAACKESGRKERVLHIHNTPRGREHVDVQMIPIKGQYGQLKYFVELLKPVRTASVDVSTPKMVGTSPAFNNAVDLINRVGPSEASVLLLGESGTGKELAARAVHDASPRRDKPFVIVECAGLTDTLFESELFGHLKGAFTGASYRKRGLVESAQGGTLFLDEVGDIPLHLQVKLLRLIESGTYRPIGSVQPQPADFRLVCATHKNLKTMVADGKFRQDLYFRINVFPICLPPLRERREDIPLVASALLHKLQSRLTLTPSAERWLSDQSFQGNIRELRNVLERACLLENSTEISTTTLEWAVAADRACERHHQESIQTLNPEQDFKSLQLRHLEKLLEEHGGDKQAAAKAAGISVRTLYRKLKEN